MMSPVYVVDAGVCFPVRGVLVHRIVVGRLTGLLSHAPGVRLTSGWRSEAHNAAVGGVRLSRHLCGMAVDIVGAYDALVELGRQAPRHGSVEVIYEGDHLHVGWPRPLS